GLGGVLDRLFAVTIFVVHASGEEDYAVMKRLGIFGIDADALAVIGELSGMIRLRGVGRAANAPGQRVLRIQPNRFVEFRDGFVFVTLTFVGEAANRVGLAR